MLSVLILFLVLMCLNVPIAFAIGVSSALFFVTTPGLSLKVAVNTIATASQTFSLLAVPFFVLAGNLMNGTGITKRMVRFATVCTGHLRGGLGHVNILLSTLMGGVSGSAAADAAMESRVLGTAMIKRGYSRGYTSAVTAMSSLITATIPPSVGLILYGTVGEVSIGRLFIAGLIPGICLMIGEMICASIRAHKLGYEPVNDRRPYAKEIFKSLFDCFWALLFPVILLVGIRMGVFTPSEAGAFAVVYAFIVGKFIYRELTWKGMIDVIKNTAIDNGVIMLIIMCSGPFGYGMSYDRLPQAISTWLLGLTSNPTLIVLIILIFFVIVGCFMEATVNVLLLTPIFLPIVKTLGFDPVWFGVLMMGIVTVGGMTPPVGVTMYTTCSILKCPVEEYVKEMLPFLWSVFIVYGVLFIFPDLVTCLPNLVYGS